jgi:hypothetical protein
MFPSRPRSTVRLAILVLSAAMAVTLRPPSAAQQAPPRQPDAAGLPARLGNQEFWKLSTGLSEIGGYFRSENLVSNEHTFQYVIPRLRRQVKPGGVYVGVAPDQNFTYIVATQPRMAFIVDIRRGNLLQHLMYKAIIELSADRADFVSRLFSKRRPAGLGATTTAPDLFRAFHGIATSDDLYRENVRSIRQHLLKRRGFPLSEEDLEQIESIYFAFFWDGPGLRYSTRPGFGGRGFGSSFPTYEDLMIQTDWDGTPHSYLATEANFRVLKDLQERNLIVPVVGDFAGPRALRAVGRYVRERRAVISTFYVSNVEQYLFQDGAFDDFVRNVATLPLDWSSTFIRSVSSRFGYPGDYLGPDGRASALDGILAFVRDFEAGRLRTYSDVNARSR